MQAYQPCREDVANSGERNRFVGVHWKRGMGEPYGQGSKVLDTRADQGREKIYFYVSSGVP